MIVGYARTSTLDQVAGFEAQLRDLGGAGCERVFQEQVSSVAKRAQLDAALSFIRDGDILVVTKLDRLARSIADLVRILAMIDERKAALRIVNLGIDTGTASGKLIVSMLGAIAEFEREMMLERQREGIRKAQAAGKYRGGRKPTARARANEVIALRQQGMGCSEIAQRLSIGRASVYRVLALPATL